VAVAEVPVRGAPVVEESASARILRVVGKAPVHLVLVVVGLLWLVPTFGLFLTSLLAAADINAEGWWQVFSEPSVTTLQSYRDIFDNEAITEALLTTLWISLGATILPIFVAAMAGYAFAWLEFPGRDWLFLAVIALLVVPLQMALIPIFTFYDKTGLFLLRNFFIGIPKELLEAARIDGASELRIFLRLILPLGLPAVASLAIFQFLWTWNDLLVALTFGRDTQPITVAIFSQLREFSSTVEVIAPASFISLALPLVVFFAFQRYFVQGLLAGSVK
jgi:alpha-glucoside transport system permease protein